MTDKYKGDPRAEELQLLRQVADQNIRTKAKETYDVAKRLELKGEAMGWWDTNAWYNVEITTTGLKALKGKPDEAR